jgi:hypothetical protein
MTPHFESTGTNPLRRLLAELRAIWLDAFRIFFRKFDFLRAEIAAATWRLFFLTIFAPLFVSVGLYQLVMGLSVQGAYEKTLRIPFNLGGYWLVQTLWSVGSAALIDIPLILLVAYLSQFWLSLTIHQRPRWVQQAHALAITWSVSILLIQAITLLEGVTREALFSHMFFTQRAIMEHRYSPLISFIFAGLLTAPIIAYRYNLRLHSNTILNGIKSRDRWLLLAFQFIMLEGGTLLVSTVILNLPIVTNFYQSLNKLWLPFQ